MLDVRARLEGTDLDYFPLEAAREAGLGEVTRLPVTVKGLLEMLRRDPATSEVSLRSLASWPDPAPMDAELPYRPARILLQDFTGVPAVVDLAAMRSAVRRAGGAPHRVD